MTDLDRRAVLAGVAGGLATSLAGCSLLEGGEDASTTDVSEQRARSLAEQFAPTLYFDEREEWFPVDPRRYESERDGETVVNGFDALDGYVRDGGGDDPPPLRVFYNVVRYEDSPLAVVQYWYYSAFDQFSTNFHWHDWELLQVFLDLEDEVPQLYVASSHARSVPNNEHLDPEERPRVLSELGSHSSGLSVNDDADGFQRLPSEGQVADITNRVVDGVAALAGLPLAYGLPRDEGLALPYVVPELDGEGIHEHPELSAVGREHLVDEAVTVRSFEALSSPPSLPKRTTGTVLEHAARDGGDRSYELRPTAELEHIAAFTGPQLSFEFAVPRVAEDAIADHVTTTGTPWEDPRYERPASDVTDPAHRQALAERYDAVGAPSPGNQVVATVTNAVRSGDAPDGKGLTTTATSLEGVALLSSEPEAVPTFNGVVVRQGVEPGEHELTVNAAGLAPHAERLTVDEGTTVAGVDGEVPLVAREDARKLAVTDGESDRPPLTRLAVEDDFAGRLYDAPLSGSDAVYVHGGGAFTTEVRDADADVGATRVVPDPEGTGSVRVESPRTGVESLAGYLGSVAEETRAEVAAATDGDDPGEGGRGDGQTSAVRGLARALAAVAEAAERVAERAAAGDRGGAEQRLEAVQTRLDTVASRLEAARDGLPAATGRATERRLAQARRRAEQARAADKL